MPSYRFLSSDHTLVMRDDHVVIWSAKDNSPVNQPGQDDELKIWKDAGSPKPTEWLIAARSAAEGVELEIPLASAPIVLPSPDESAAGTLAEIDATLSSLSADDTAGVKQQMHELIQALCALLGAKP